MADMFDPVEQASYDLVHDFKGGAPRLASLTNMNAGTLQHKVNPSMDSHHLLLKEAINLMVVSNDYRLLHVICASLGFVCVPSGKYENVSDVEFLSIYTNTMKEVGDMSSVIHDIFSGKHIKSHDVIRLRKESFEAIAAIAELPARLEGMCDE